MQMPDASLIVKSHVKLVAALNRGVLWRGVRCLLLCVALWPAWHASAANLEVGQAQDFVFTPQGYFAAKPLKVHYYKASSADANAKVLITIHGVERNGKNARDNWVAVAEKQRLIILAPEFDAADYPTRLFQMGGMESADPTHWTFTLIEQLFAQLKAQEGLAADTYLLFGHSAGAQFAHRFALLMPQSHASVIISANAGSYTAPGYADSVLALPYPWTLNERVVSVGNLKQALGRKVIVLLGEEDTKTSSADFPKSREAAQFGATRLERGTNFFARAKAQADKLNTPFGWELHTVPGVGHNSRAMAKAAAAYFFSVP